VQPTLLYNGFTIDVVTTDFVLVLGFFEDEDEDE